VPSAVRTRTLNTQTTQNEQQQIGLGDRVRSAITGTFFRDTPRITYPPEANLQIGLNAGRPYSQCGGQRPRAVLSRTSASVMLLSMQVATVTAAPPKNAF
jgi:hypothetical protein